MSYCSREIDVLNVSRATVNLSQQQVCWKISGWEYSNTFKLKETLYLKIKVDGEMQTHVKDTKAHAVYIMTQLLRKAEIKTISLD